MFPTSLRAFRVWRSAPAGVELWGRIRSQDVGVSVRRVRFSIREARVRSVQHRAAGSLRPYRPASQLMDWSATTEVSERSNDELPPESLCASTTDFFLLQMHSHDVIMGSVSGGQGALNKDKNMQS